MDCKYCNFKHDKPNIFKTHLSKKHKEVSELDRELFFLKETFGVDVDIKTLKKYYCDGKSFPMISEEIGIPYENLRKLANIDNWNIRSQSEQLKTQAVQSKLKSKWNEKYGQTNPSKLKWVKEKKKKTFEENFGYENNFCNAEILKCALQNIDYSNLGEKIRESCQKKYGVDNPTQLKHIRKILSEKAALRMSKLSYEERLKLTESARRSISYVSSQEIRIQKILTEHGIDFKPNVFLYRFNFDFMFRKKKLLEIQGDFWHGNPLFYKENDVLLGNMTAGDVWEKDFRKKKVLDKNGYKIYYLWENEINKMGDDELLQWIGRNILNEN